MFLDTRKVKSACVLLKLSFFWFDHVNFRGTDQSAEFS